MIESIFKSIKSYQSEGDEGTVTGMKILIVDYKELVLSTLGAFMKDCGHEIFTAKSAEEAVERDGEGEDIDAILIDPGDTQYVVNSGVSKVHNRYPGADIVLMGFGSMDGDFALANGVFAFFKHPLHLCELEVILARISEKRALAN